MKVLWLRPNKPENISIGRHRIAELLRERGHIVSVWNTTPSDLVDVLRQDLDVVIGTTRLGALIGSCRKVLRGTPFVVDHIDPITQLRRSHGPVFTWWVSHLEELTFRVADHVMVVYEEELPRVKRATSAVTPTHLGVDFEKFANPPEASITQARKLLNANTRHSSKQVIYVGGLEPAYNIQAIVDAMVYLDDWDFVVLGDGSQRHVVEDPASENVHYLGTVPHEVIPGFLHQVDVGICLLDDRNTLKILEYGAAGLPAVKVEGDAEARFSGLVEFCSLEPTSVAGAIRRAAQRGTAEKFQEFTRQYSWEAVADHYEEVLQGVIDDEKTNGT